MVWEACGFSGGPIRPMHRMMVHFSETVWVVLAFFALVCLFGVGHVLASSIFFSTRTHRLKHEVVRLRAYYTAQMEALALGEDPSEIPEDLPSLIEYLRERDAEIVEVGEVDEDGPDGVLEVGQAAEPAKAAA
jgi:hypothetical protein